MVPVLRSDCKSWGTVTQLQSLALEGRLIGLPENTITFLTVPEINGIKQSEALGYFLAAQNLSLRLNLLLCYLNTAT